MKIRNPEADRLDQDARRELNWKRWGPYLAERQWGTVREDYSADGDAWGYFPHQHARSRAYRWGEDGLLGWCDREGRLCFALSLWNERDPILKERLFGLTNPQGNHGEDVKECYYYLDSTPTHSYAESLYKYPQAAFPYQQLLEENARRGPEDPEFELLDTGIFEDNRYFDVFMRYAKAGPDDLLIELEACNRGPEAAPLVLLPILWFRNTWSWGRQDEGYGPRPELWHESGKLRANHHELGEWELSYPDDPEVLFCENETNVELLYGQKGPGYYKDGFHRYLVESISEAVNPEGRGTRAALAYRLQIPAGGSQRLRLRLRQTRADDWQKDFQAIFQERREEADLFYADHSTLARRAYAGLLWSKQFYNYAVHQWLDGDPGQPSPPPQRRKGRNKDWIHLYNRDVILMPDKWEYPWYAAWDQCFHCVAIAPVDIDLAQDQLLLLMREWYMHARGQLPAYEWDLDGVNPPVQAWAALRVYRGCRDRAFLERAFHKLLVNFTWWVNREGKECGELFGGGFLGMDNVGVIDRSNFSPSNGRLLQTDGSAWIAFYCLRLLQMALELAREESVYEDIASKFFEHFVYLNEALNSSDLWNEEDGFYYDVIVKDGKTTPLRVRSMVGLLPLIAVEVLPCDLLQKMPAFHRRLEWFRQNHRSLSGRIYQQGDKILLSLVPPDRQRRILERMLDPDEFLSPHGLRSLSKYHERNRYEFCGNELSYAPGESKDRLFGGNSNWRGPIWIPVNYLLIEALERLHVFYQDDFQIGKEGQQKNLQQIAHDLHLRLISIFEPDEKGARPVHGNQPRYAQDPHWKDLILFYEYYHGDTGQGLGASHQTGWSALVGRLLEKVQRGGLNTAPPVVIE